MKHRRATEKPGSRLMLNPAAAKQDLTCPCRGSTPHMRMTMQLTDAPACALSLGARRGSEALPQEILQQAAFSSCLCRPP